MTRPARRALLRDMSACWRELNTTLQLIGHGATQGVYGRGRRRGRKRAEATRRTGGGGDSN